MPATQEMVEEKQVKVTPSGKQVVKQKTAMSASVDAVDTINQLITFVAGIVEILLMFRLLLKLLGANPVNSFVNFIYMISGPLELPFRGIFPTEVSPGIVTRSILEPSTVVAMFVYIVITVGIVQLVTIMSRQSEEE